MITNIDSCWAQEQEWLQLMTTKCFGGITSRIHMT